MVPNKGMGVPDVRLFNVLILNRDRFVAQFHQDLCETLRALGARVTCVTTQSEAMSVLDGEPLPFGLWLVDPTVEGFDPIQTRSQFERLSQNERPHVLSIVAHPDDDYIDLNEALNVAAKLAKSFDSHDLAFVLNRLLRPMETNRRSFPRALMSVNAAYRRRSRDELKRERTFNLSTGGMFLRSLEPELAGSSVEIAIDLADGADTIEASARVVYARPYSLGATALYPAGMGLCFQELAEAHRQRIAAFIRPHLMRIDTISA